MSTAASVVVDGALPLAAVPANREQSTLRGSLFVLAPTALLLGRYTEAPADLATLGVALSLLLGGALLGVVPSLGRLFGSVGAIGLAALWTLPRLDRPGWAFVVLFACSALLARIWPPAPIRRTQRGTPLLATVAPDALSALGTLVAVWLVVAVGRLVPAWSTRPELLLASIVPPLLALRHLPAPPARRVMLSLGLLAPAIALVLRGADPLASAAVIPPVTALLTWLAVRDADREGDLASPWLLLLQHPPRLLVVTFALQCVLGGMLLVLPGATTHVGGIGFIDALFTAVSATCVTGLTVLDTARDFTMTGQLVILLLIQVGGLGIMTFSAAALVLLARRMSYRAEATAADLIGADDVAGLGRALGRVLIVTFAAEGIGAAVLAGAFWAGGDSVATAAWRGLFTAVSAFCNAGFALQSDNLVRYAEQPLVLHTVALLMVLGGLGPAVVAALPRLRTRRGRRRLSLHVRLVLLGTAVLLVGPAVLIAVVEWGHALGHLAPLDRLHNAWFQSATTRTAGFYSVDPNALQPTTVTLMMVLMFIGGAPGSTAGGAKITTIAVLVLAVIAAIEGRNEVEVSRRRIPHEVVYRAGAIATLCMLTVGGALFALQVTQAQPMESLLFEAVSAMGTGGLSLGATARLDDFGKLVIMGCMFAGRVGPLTLFLLLSDTRRNGRAHLPAEPVPVG